MRPELEILEKIDRYLNGQMSGTESELFKSQVASDPTLKGMVDNQQLMIKTVNRQALMSEINMVAGTIGASPWYASMTTWIVSGVVLTGIVSGLIFFNLDEVELDKTIVENVESVDEKQMTVVSDETLETEIVDNFESSIHFSNNIRQVVADNSNEASETVDSSLLTIIGEVGPSLLDGVSELEESSKEHEEDIIKIRRSERASFPGGSLPMKRYIKKNIKFPGTAEKKGIEGNVKVYFYVFTTGKIEITNSQCIQLKRSNNKPFGGFKMAMNRRVQKLFEREAERLIRLMPTWEPATDQNGNAITVPMVIYFNFDAEGNSSAYDLDFDRSEREEKVFDGVNSSVNIIESDSSNVKAKK